MAKWHKEYNDDEELENQDNTNQEEVLTPEEITWKKRYGDLRRHEQEEVNTKNAEIIALKKQLESAANNTIKLPKTPEEIKEWATTYPDVAAIVRTIAMEENTKSKSELDELRTNITNERLENDRRNAIVKLDHLHPDFFPEIKDSDEFDVWLKSKSKRTYAALYENDTDADAAAEVIAMYKYETGFNTGKKSNTDADNNRDAARDTRVKDRQDGPVTTNEMVFSESQINNMSIDEYSKLEPDIDKAMKEGKVLMDVTGGAR